jgi:predicted nucleotidyltransferase component of viral defense system
MCSLSTLVAKKIVAFSDRFSGKDLYDIYYALKSGVNLMQVAEALTQILASEHIERNEFITDLTKKLEDERKIERVHASSNPYIPRKLRVNWVWLQRK